VNVLAVAMFFGTFAWAFVFISLPFHIQRVSPWDPITTLRWTGWILGISPLLTVATAPFWGRYAERANVKTLYVLTQYLQGLGFFGMALARTLPELFFSRVVLGVIGAASTFAFVSAGRSGDVREVRRQVVAVQSAMTVGQVIGPLAGAIAAARLGFRGSFILGGAILVGCGVLVQWGVPAGASAQPREIAVAPLRWKETLAVALVVLGGSTQVFFLTAILPQVLHELGIADDRTLEVGGILIFVSGVAAALGSVAAARVGEWVSEPTLLPTLLVASSALVGALAFASSVWLYGGLRFLQVLCIAPVFPIVVARIAHSAGGAAIGIVNSARIGAAFLGPVVATTLLAWSSRWILYLVLALIGLACLPLAAPRPATAGAGR